MLMTADFYKTCPFCKSINSILSRFVVTRIQPIKASGSHVVFAVLRRAPSGVAMKLLIIFGLSLGNNNSMMKPTIIISFINLANQLDQP